MSINLNVPRKAKQINNNYYLITKEQKNKTVPIVKNKQDNPPYNRKYKEAQHQNLQKFSKNDKDDTIFYDFPTGIADFESEEVGDI